jgi:hypothetical protein
MKLKKLLIGFAVAAYIGVGYVGLHKIIIYPYFILPLQDKGFLEDKPTEAEILLRFGKPEETITRGEHFASTGWYPTPETKASHTGYSFMRHTQKYYIFISTNKTLESYTIGRS